MRGGASWPGERVRMRRRTIHVSGVLAVLAVGLFAFGCSSWTAPEPPPASALPAAPDPGATEQPTTEPAPTSSSDPTSSPGTTVVVGTDVCSTDADCVPATCCQPVACIAASKAPKCDAVRCARDCSKPTTVCGGGCLCQGGHCAARLGTTP